MKGHMLFVAALVAAAPFAASRAQDRPDAPSPQDIAAGKAVFEGKAGGALCVSCHGAKGKGVQGLGPDLTDATWLHGDGSLAFLQAIVRSGVMKPKAGVLSMPPMGGGKLDDAQLKALAAYLLSLRG